MNKFIYGIMTAIFIFFLAFLFVPRYQYIDSHTRMNTVTGKIEKSDSARGF